MLSSIDSKAHWNRQLTLQASRTDVTGAPMQCEPLWISAPSLSLWGKCLILCRDLLFPFYANVLCESGRITIFLEDKQRSPGTFLSNEAGPGHDAIAAVISPDATFLAAPAPATTRSFGGAETEMCSTLRTNQ
jgi:hypothetical protein